LTQWIMILPVAVAAALAGAVTCRQLLRGQVDKGKCSGVSDAQDAVLRDSEDRYRLLAENASDVIWVVNWPGLAYTYISPSVARLRGISVQDAVAENFIDSFVPEQRDRVRRLIDKRIRAYHEGRIEQSRVQRVQVRQRCADGEEKVVEISASLVVDDNDRVIAIQGSSRDVSARVSAEQERQAREAILHALAQAARMLFSASDKDKVMEPALAALARAVGADRVYVFENHRVRQSGKLLASQRYEWCGPGIKSELGNPSLQGMDYEQVIPNWRRVLESGEAVHGLVSEMPQPERDLLEPQDIESIVVVPIFLDGGFWGQIGFDDCSRQRQWSQPEIDALQVAAGVIGGAIHSIRVEDELRRLVSTDSLTGVRSRRAFLEQAGLLFDEAGSRNETLALLLMDLDHFKAINDNHGHPVGDEALRGFARICRQSLRPDDLVGRTGGEEFAVVLTTVGHERAIELAEKLRRNVSSQPLTIGSVEVPLSVSIGVAVKRDDEFAFASLLKRADVALYEAKKKGRNRVESADGF
jgi:diguanylate cyclase (GGDEF)-like protein/PAS domain S-box-containing protein